MSAPASDFSRRRRAEGSRRPNRPREVLFLLLGLAGIAAAILGIAALLGATAFAPRAAASAYLGLIADGRLAEASDTVDPGVDDGTLLVDRALDDPADRIHDVEILATEVDGPVALVHVAYVLDGERHETSLTLHRGFDFLGLASAWRVASPLVGAVQLAPGPADRMTVNGVPVSPTPGGSAYAAYPGRYTVTVPDDDPYFLAAEPVTVAVAGTGGVPVELALEGTDALTAAVQDAVDAAAAVCAQSGDRNPVACPFGIEIFDEYQNLHWTLVALPTVSVDAAAGAFSSTAPGRAVASYEVQTFDGRGWEPDSRATGFTVSGTFTVSDGTVAVQLAE